MEFEIMPNIHTLVVLTKVKGPLGLSQFQISAAEKKPFISS
jgi:hypothetical protein